MRDGLSRTVETRAPTQRCAVTAQRKKEQVHLRKFRIALYSHDTKGLGHLRRNHLIAGLLADSKLPCSVLLIAGTRYGSAFPMPAGVDCVTLPGFHKSSSGQYESRSLGISLQQLVVLRSEIIRASLDAFQPDALIVDYAPQGAFQELKPALERIKASGDVRCVFGLRDILFDPAVVQHEWSVAGQFDALQKFYDEIWVYGDASVYDLAHEYQFGSELAAKVRFTGYLDSSKRLDPTQDDGPDLIKSLALPPGRIVLCLVGGGQDGEKLGDVFTRVELPPETNGILVTGPFMPAEHAQRLHRRVDGNPRMRILDFVRQPNQLLQHADRVIAQGGYNAICEVLSLEKRALIVPRVNGRREQIIRVERLHELGLVDCIYPDRLTPEAIRSWLVAELPPPHVRDRIDFNSTTQIPRLMDELLSRQPHPIQPIV